jgi:hypothetical protein
MEKKLKVLIACEESQTVTKEFRQLGHDAYSCDLQDCSGGHPEWHLKYDVIEELKKDWDLIIAHPPCTFMSKAGARWMYPTAGNICDSRLKKGIEAKDFFLKCLNANAKYIAVENPQPLKIIGLPDYSQIIQPYQFGHPFSKKTLLWLKGLPNLVPTDIVSEFKPYLPSNTGGKKRGQSFMFKNITQKESSKTFTGIAKAMAEQWSVYIINQPPPTA